MATPRKTRRNHDIMVRHYDKGEKLKAIAAKIEISYGRTYDLVQGMRASIFDRLVAGEKPLEISIDYGLTELSIDLIYRKEKKLREERKARGDEQDREIYGSQIVYYAELMAHILRVFTGANQREISEEIGVNPADILEVVKIFKAGDHN